jgi:hypothetical protein
VSRILSAVLIVAALPFCLAGCAPDTTTGPPSDQRKPAAVTPAEFGAALADAIDDGQWEFTDEFFTSAVRAARRCGLDPKLIDQTFGEVGDRRPLDKAAFSQKARGMK